MFFTGLTILSSLINTIALSAAPLNTTRLNANKLSCISMSNQPSRARPEIVMLIAIIQHFILVLLKQVNVVEIVIILMIRTQKYVFLML